MLVYAKERPLGSGETLSRAAAYGADGVLSPAVKLAAPGCGWLAWMRSLSPQQEAL